MDKKSIKKSVAELLQKNARISDLEIAERLQLTPAKVRTLIREMETDRIITGYHAVIDEEKLGLEQVRAIIEVEVQPERDSGFDRVARAISNFPEVVSVLLVSGRYDLRLEVVGESLQDVAFFVASKLAAIDGVKATATHFLLKKYKTVGFMLQEDAKYERLKVVP